VDVDLNEKRVVPHRGATEKRSTVAAHDAGRLQFFGDHVGLADKAAFDAHLTPLHEIDWVVYAKEPFAGPLRR